MSVRKGLLCVSPGLILKWCFDQSRPTWHHCKWVQATSEASAQHRAMKTTPRLLWRRVESWSTWLCRCTNASLP